MPDSEDSLRTALRELADQAGPAKFPAGPLIRRAARRRARFTAASGFCALAVAAAVAVPVATRGHPGPAGPKPPASPAPVVTSQWDLPFVCGQPLPSGLPPATGDGLRMAIGAVTRTASGEPAVRWSLHGSGTAIGPISADLLIVGVDGNIFAAEPAPQPVVTAVPSSRFFVPPGQIFRYEPLLVSGTTGGWAAIWQDHQEYRVVIVATVWAGHGKSAIPVRLSVTAALPRG